MSLFANIALVCASISTALAWLELRRLNARLDELERKV